MLIKFSYEKERAAPSKNGTDIFTLFKIINNINAIFDGDIFHQKNNKITLKQAPLLLSLARRWKKVLRQALGRSNLKTNTVGTPWLKKWDIWMVGGFMEISPLRNPKSFTSEKSENALSRKIASVELNFSTQTQKYGCVLKSNYWYFRRSPPAPLYNFCTPIKCAQKQ